MKFIISSFILLMVISANAQVTSVDSVTNEPLNAINNVIKGNSSKNITVGAYGEIHYNQPFGGVTRSNGKMDVHRLVTFMGYSFSDKVQFVSEIEFEHVVEVYIEQAFLNYNVGRGVNLRAGLMLVPMGIVNEYHEPTTFNGVERPNLSGQIIPTTWREIGTGVSGTLSNYSLKYQAYLFNGFNSYADGAGKLRGKDGFRKGRQKAAESIFTTPNFSAKLDYYGVPGLKVGLATYMGKTQSEEFDGLDMNDSQMVQRADSSVVGIRMTGLDFRYKFSGWQARGVLIHSKVLNTMEYNNFTNSDLGSSMFGYYLEGGYDLLKLFSKDNSKQQLVYFARYEKYDTHNTVGSEIVENKAYDRTDITTGLSYHVATGAVLKMDLQFMNNAENKDYKKQLNLGVGIWF